MPREPLGRAQLERCPPAVIAQPFGLGVAADSFETACRILLVADERAAGELTADVADDAPIPEQNLLPLQFGVKDEEIRTGVEALVSELIGICAAERTHDEIHAQFERGVV